jgi:2-oxoglutarate ferredoxin oxidoreductase subunit beta
VFVLGAGARFVARGIDAQQKDLPGILKRAHEHNGASFVEVLQNCIVYNDGVFADITEKAIAADRQVVCRHGEPLVFGKDHDKGIKLNTETLALEVVPVGDDGPEAAGVLVHDETNRTLATMLAGMDDETLPVAVGVIYCDPGESYGDGVARMKDQAVKRADGADLKSIMHAGHTWKVAD